MAHGDGDHVLVTGAAGFIGRHLVAKLASCGARVLATDLATSGAHETPDVEWRTLDVRDADQLAASVSGFRPDVIYHLAALASVPSSMADPAADVETNVLGTVNVAVAAVAVGVRRVVFFSTGGALYGDPERLPVDESQPPSPASVYGASKAAAERYLHVITAGTDTDVAILRPGNVYGPGQNPGGDSGVAAIFLAQMIRREPVTIFGDGSQERDYVYVDDVVDAALRAARWSKGATCMIATGVGTSTQRIFDLLAGEVGYDLPPHYAPERPGDIQRISLSPRRARELWGWEPLVGLEQGMALTASWFTEDVSRLAAPN